MELGDVEYARSGDVSIAYQVVGDGPVDLVFVPFLFNLAFGWTHPKFGRLIERLASLARVIAVDKRGTGLSDRFRDLPTLGTRMDYVRAVLGSYPSRFPTRERSRYPESATFRPRRSGCSRSSSVSFSASRRIARAIGSLHTGECELVGGKVAGLAVNIGARVTEAARPGEVLVSSTVKISLPGPGSPSSIAASAS